jgi:predicted phosphodiesterase
MDGLFIAKIWGNHEKAVMDNDTTRFATDRGRAILHYPQKRLSQESIGFINNRMNHDGTCSLEIDGKKFLLVHGILGDPYWGKFTPAELMREEYAPYDFVLTAHSHVCHYFEVLFKADSPSTRNKKKTVFINPGSVGQPRNINPCAQFGILDTETTEYEHICVPYDIKAEQELYTDEVDVFYKARLTLGI